MKGKKIVLRGELRPKKARQERQKLW
uniref:Uncharacterized protein n=1 Tax=Rhizophora mucronata TaxID=61149 RepID=A0A2P2PGK1_RHIMU